MRYAKVFVLALALGACADPNSGGGSSQIASATTSTIPPARLSDCNNYALLDDKCTADWYRCKGAPDDEGGTCVRAWKTCCSLPGQGARSGLDQAQSLSQY
jgi:hypothetical protein